MKKTAAIYVHGKGGSAKEAEHYAPLLRECDVIGFDYRSQTPWDARAEFPAFFEQLRQRYGEIMLIANSIGAYFALHALGRRQVDRAFLISPIVNMEALILRMMAQEGVTEQALHAHGEIPTAFGETLSWKYLCYAREHPLAWEVPTAVLYGEKDALVPPAEIATFAERTGAALTVMPGGEHRFHTEEQTAFLDQWLQKGLFS